MRTDRLNALIHYLEDLPDEKFDMQEWAAGLSYGDAMNAGELGPDHCGTAGCIAGHIVSLFSNRDHVLIKNVARDAEELMEFPSLLANDLFNGAWHWKVLDQIPKADAIACLKHVAVYEAVPYFDAPDDEVDDPWIYDGEERTEA